jgi:type I restriction enzyme S subunit
MKAGWEMKSLGEVCTLQRGFDLPTQDRKTGRFPLVSSSGISDAHNEGPVLSPGVVTGRSGSIGNVFYIEDAFWPLNTTLYVRDFHGNLPRFIYYLLVAFDLKKYAGGTGVPTLNRNDVHCVPVIVPSELSEQQRIVTLLDEAFDGIATARAHAEKNLQNARAIFESHLQSVFADKAKEWPDRLLGDVFNIGSSKRIYETDWTTQGVPFFGGREIVKLAKFGSVESASFISEEKYQEYASKYEMPQADDILMTARGTIGVGYIVKPDDKFYYKDGNVISLRAKNPSNPKFILYAFRSNAILDQLTVLVGTTVSHLPIEKAKMLKICMPTFEAQNSMVAHLEMMEAHSKELETIYKQKLTALDELKKSLLHRAFNGDL